MPKAKKFFLLHERRETWRLRLGPERHGYCEQCQEETLWLTSVEATGTSDFNEREIFRLTESGAIHSVESDSGLLLVCGRSLEAASPRKPET